MLANYFTFTFVEVCALSSGFMGGIYSDDIERHISTPLFSIVYIKIRLLTKLFIKNVWKQQTCIKWCVPLNKIDVIESGD